MSESGTEEPCTDSQNRQRDPKHRQGSKPKSSPSEQKYQKENPKEKSPRPSRDHENQKISLNRAKVQRKTHKQCPGKQGSKTENKKPDTEKTQNRHRRLEPGVGRKVQVQNGIRRTINQTLKHLGLNNRDWEIMTHTMENTWGIPQSIR